MRYKSAVYLVLISGISYGFTPIFAVFGYQNGLNTLTFNFLRSLVATLVFCVYLLIKRERIRVTRTQLLWLLLMGGVLNVLQSTFYISSVKYLSASLTTLLFFVYPLLVAVLSHLINREILSRKTVIAIVVSFVGLGLVLGSSLGKVNMYGVLASLSAAVFYTLFIVLGSSVVKQVNPAVTSSYILLFTTISFSIIGRMVYGVPNLHFNIVAWLAGAGCGILGSSIAFFTFFSGLKVVGSTTASILSNIEPLTTLLLSALLFAQHLTGWQLAGGLLILAGGTMAVQTKSRFQPRKILLSRQPETGG